MRILNLLAILIIGLLIISCGKKQSQNSGELDYSENMSEQSNAESLKKISSQTQSKIDKWKNECDAISNRVSSNEFSKYDFSKFWEKKYDLGYIGKNFQRMLITFEKVTKISSDEYSIVGFSQVKSNVCKFKGTIHNITFNQYKLLEDDCQGYNYENALSRGCVIADFKIEEDPNQKGTGVFLGVLQSQWVILANGNIEQTFSGCGDGEIGDQFFGDWISYKGGNKFVAWGVYRIPFSDELDIGASEFCPVEEYINYGWEEYKQ
jgi:hypothetical protein